MRSGCEFLREKRSTSWAGMKCQCNPHEPIHLILCRLPPPWTETATTIYNVINPFQWMDTISLQGSQNKLLLEMSERIRKKWSQYYKRPQTSHVLSWWSVLKGSACNKSHLPFFLHLSTYLCYPNLHSRSRTSYMVLPYLANLTTRRCLSIYYPGSIENIKLLGALYWLTDWLQYIYCPLFNTLLLPGIEWNHTALILKKTM
jgi:hypothetical protein